MSFPFLKALIAAAETLRHRCRSYSEASIKACGGEGKVDFNVNTDDITELGILIHATWKRPSSLRPTGLVSMLVVSIQANPTEKDGDKLLSG